MTNCIKNKITYTNFFLSVLIIWHHAYNIEVYDLHNGFLFSLENYLLTFCEIAVPFFFAISAFLFYHNVNDDNLLKKLKSRIFSLVIPLLIWNLIGYLYFQIISLFPFIKSNYGGYIEPFSIIGMISQMIKGDYNLVTWFLKTLIIFTYTGPIIYKLFKNKISMFLILVFSYFINIFGFKSNVQCCFCFYCFGMYFALFHKDLVLKNYSKKIKMLSSLLLFLSIFIYTLYSVDYISIFGRILYTIMFSSLWVLLDIFKIANNPKWWMKQNLIYYCGHEMILEPIEKIILILLGNNLLGATLDFIFAPIISLLLLVCISILIRKIKPLYNLLIGFR